MTSIQSTLPQAHQSLFEAKTKSGLTFAQIAERMGPELNRTEVWVAAVFYGQAKPTAEDLAALAKVLSVQKSLLTNAMPESWFPERGLGPMPPTDPLLYRLYEILVVFGYPIKSVIHEKFGDGIMSAIDFRTSVDKVEEDGAERVKISLIGKWLPYKRF